MRLISKVKPGRWKCQHSDGTVTFHKTLKAAKAFVRFTYKWEVENDQ